MARQSAESRKIGLVIDKKKTYKKGCSAKRGCKKVGLLSSLSCTNCQGQSCSNVQLSTMEEDSCDFKEMT